jgi:hypothetical protein
VGLCFVLVLLGVYVCLCVAGSDLKQWTIKRWWFNGQWFNTIQDLIASWNADNKGLRSSFKLLKPGEGMCVPCNCGLYQSCTSLVRMFCSCSLQQCPVPVVCTSVLYLCFVHVCAFVYIRCIHVCKVRHPITEG